MNQQDDVISLELDGVTTSLLVHLAEVWGVTEEDALHRAIELANAALGPLTEREAVLLTRYLRGYEHDEIAAELNEDIGLAGSDLNVMKTKVHYRLKKATEKTTAAGRLEAFKELQRRLRLTAAKAAEWQDAVREARR